MPEKLLQVNFSDLKQILDQTRVIYRSNKSDLERAQTYFAFESTVNVVEAAILEGVDPDEFIKVAISVLKPNNIQEFIEKMDLFET